MNLYVRYFDNETLATNIDEVVSFLKSINEINVDDNVIGRIINFAESDGIYPFRLKVSYSNYVLFLKTDAKNLEEFKILEKQRKEQRSDGRMLISERKKTILDILNEPHSGWYDATIYFKRVIQNPETGKCKYVDTRFRVRLLAESAMHCYERIITHLQNRQDVDPRSQYPSAKSSNFEYVFLDSEKEKNSETSFTEASNSSSSEIPSTESVIIESSTSLADKLDLSNQGTLDYPDEASEFAS